MLDFFEMLWLWSVFVAIGKSAVTPVSTGQDQPSPNHPVALPNATLLRETPYIFHVPSSPINLHLSNFHGLLNQGELDLCIIEGMSIIVDKVADKGSDGRLPLHIWSAKWANIMINIEDVRPPEFAMTYGYLASTLRGVAFFASLYGYVEMDVDVYHETVGYVGTGYLGQIIPAQSS